MKKLVLALMITTIAGSVPHASASARTSVSIVGDKFEINGAYTNLGRPNIEGMLLNARMINAAFNDRNEANRLTAWAYPDTRVWDAQRNTDEFTAQIPSYATDGLNMITVGLQGGDPWPSGSTHPRDEIVSAFNPNGKLRARWMSRLSEIIDAADAAGMVVDLSLFYVYQDQIVTADARVEEGAKAVLDWVASHGYTNVLLEVCNECNDPSPGFAHDNLKPSVGLAAFLSALNGYSTVPVSASFTSNYWIPDAIIDAEDFVTMHCNSRTANEVISMVQDMDARTTKPIVFNECGTDLTKMSAGVDAGASWGYYDQGSGSDHYTTGSGFQAVPANWGPTVSTLKTAFFDAICDAAVEGTAPA
jgi:hypothetical protein